MDREKLPSGIWACPNCPTGWQVYMIASDMNVCAVCGYKGGPVPQPHRDPKAVAG